MIKRLLYSTLFGALRLLARLPLSVLYILSDFIYILLAYVLRYRKSVIDTNMQRSFPEMSLAQIKKHRLLFYKNFADYIVETVKLLHISDEEMRERMVFENAEIIDRALDNGRSVAAYFSHCFNWEWATSFTLYSDPSEHGDAMYGQVYQPLKNKQFNDFMLALRSRFGTVSTARHDLYRTLSACYRDGRLTMTGIMADQIPSTVDHMHVMRFLNQPTGIISGTETLARRLDMVVVYWDIYKVSRGHYKIIVRLLAEDPKQLPANAITEMYARHVEDTIRRNPSLWLWSHRRWKRPVTLPSE